MEGGREGYSYHEYWDIANYTYIPNIGYWCPLLICIGMVPEKAVLVDI